MPRRRKAARLWYRKDDDVWVILDGTKQIRTGCGAELRDEAEEALSVYLQEKVARQIVTHHPSRISVGEILARYGEWQAPWVKDPERLVYSIQALAPFWANKLVSAVDEDSCLAYVRWRKRAASTVRREMNTLNAALKKAEQKRLISYAPSVLLPPKGIAKDRWLQRDEADALMQAASPHVQRFIRIALATGRRKSAILGLKWQPSPRNGWIDLEQGIIHFLGRGEEETKKVKGQVRIPEKLLAEIRGWEQDGPNVISFRGEPLADIKKGFGEAVRRAGLEDITPHTLKHTAVTWAFIEGMTMEQAVDYFATSRETLERVYRSYSPHAQKEAAAIMDRLL